MTTVILVVMLMTGGHQCVVDVTESKFREHVRAPYHPIWKPNGRKVPFKVKK